MKDHLMNCQQLLEAGQYKQLLEELKPWGEEAPGQLWAVVAWLILEQDPEAGYINYEEAN